MAQPRQRREAATREAWVGGSQIGNKPYHLLAFKRSSVKISFNSKSGEKRLIKRWQNIDKVNFRCPSVIQDSGRNTNIMPFVD